MRWVVFWFADLLGALGTLGYRVAGRHAPSLFEKKKKTKVVLGAAGCGVRLGLGFCLDFRSGMEGPGRAPGVREGPKS